MKNRFLHLLFCLFGISASLASPTPERLQKLSRGVNLSHWLWMPLPNGTITDKDLSHIKAAGMTHVRLPISSATLVKDWNKPESLDDNFLKEIMTAITMITKHGLAVVISPFDTVDQKVRQNLTVVQRFWHAFSITLQKTDPEMVFVQIANEPDVPNPKEWHRISNALVHTVRNNLPHHTILTATPLKFGDGPQDWGTPQALLLSQPINDSNIVYALNFYDPFFFTHQGATWTEETAKSIHGLTYPGDPENVALVKKDLPHDHWIQGWLDNYGKTAKKQSLEAQLKPLFDWVHKNKAALLFTEFGVHKPAPQDSRRRWMKDMRDIFEDNKAGWCAWDYAGAFSITDENKKILQEIKK